MHIHHPHIYTHVPHTQTHRPTGGPGASPSMPSRMLIKMLNLDFALAAFSGADKPAVCCAFAAIRPHRACLLSVCVCVCLCECECVCVSVSVCLCVCVCVCMTHSGPGQYCG